MKKIVYCFMIVLITVSFAIAAKPGTKSKPGGGGSGGPTYPCPGCGSRPGGK